MSKNNIETTNDLDHTLEKAGLTKQQRQQVIPKILLYIFKEWDQNDLTVSLDREQPGLSKYVGPVIKGLPTNGAILRDDKVRVFTYFCHVTPAVRRATSNEFKPGHMKVPKKVPGWIKRALTPTAGHANKLLCRHLQKLRTQLLTSTAKNASNDEDRIPPMDSIAKAAATEGSIILSDEIQDYAAKFVYKKFAFVLNSYGVEAHDIKSDLIARAMYAMRMHYPNWRAVGDLLAISKSAIASAGANLLHYYSAESRAKMDTDNNWKEQSIDNALTPTDAEHSAAAEGVSYEALVFSDASLRIVNARISIDNLIKHVPEHQPRKRILLGLLGGRYNKEFSEFLGQRNDEYADEVELDELIKKVSKYLDADPEQVVQYLQSLNPFIQKKRKNKKRELQSGSEQ